MTKNKTTQHKAIELDEETEDVNISVNINTVLVIVLAILFVFSAFQTTQLVALNGAVAENNSKIGAALGGATVTGVTTQTTKVASTSTTSSVPQSLQNLPDMVGGC